MEGGSTATRKGVPGPLGPLKSLGRPAALDVGHEVTGFPAPPCPPLPITEWGDCDWGQHFRHVGCLGGVQRRRGTGCLLDPPGRPAARLVATAGWAGRRRDLEATVAATGVLTGEDIRFDGFAIIRGHSLPSGQRCVRTAAWAGVDGGHSRRTGHIRWGWSLAHTCPSIRSCAGLFD